MSSDLTSRTEPSLSEISEDAPLSGAGSTPDGLDSVQATGTAATPPSDDFDLDDLEARLNRIGTLADDARKELHAPAAEPPDGVGDTLPVDSVEGSGGSLRSQLAEMFGVDVNSFDDADQQQELPDEPAAAVRSVDESIVRVDDHATGEVADAAVEESVSFLPPSSDPEDVVAEPAPAAAPEPAKSGGGDDDSIESYMERLLARSRGTEPTSPPPKAEPAKPVAEPTVAKVADELPPEGDLSAAVVTARDRRFRKPINKDQLRREVSSLRELALQSSRAAVAKSRRAELRAQLQSRIVVVVVAAVVSGILLVSPMWSRESFVYYGVGGLLVTFGVAMNFYRTYRNLAADLAAVQHEIDETDNAPAKPIHDAEPQLDDPEPAE